MRTSLEKGLCWAILCGIFATPFIALLVVPALYAPFEAPKGFTFRIVVEAIALLSLALALVAPRYRPRRSWILAVFAIFLFVMAIADVQGVNPYDSFWGELTHMDGWLMLVHVFLFVIVTSSIVTTEILWRRLFQTSLAVSAVIAVIGFLKFFGVAGFWSGWTAWTAQMDSIMGNPSYLAVYMLFHVFIAALLLVQSSEGALKNKRLPLAYGGVLILDAAAVFYTGIRGAVLGLLCGGIVILVLFAFLHGSRRYRWIASIAIVLTVVVGGTVKLASSTPLIQNIPPLERVVSISFGDSSVLSRLALDSISWQAFKERPILGWGQGNYLTAFSTNISPQIDVGVDNWVDRAHNMFFEELIAGGVIGFAAYLSMFAVLLGAAWKSRKSSLAEKAVLTGLLVSYFVQNLTFFDTVESYILFGTVIAYIIFRSGAAEIALTRYTLPKRSLPYVTTLAMILAALIAWRLNANAIYADVALGEAAVPQQNGYAANLAYFERAISYDSFGTGNARWELAKMASTVSGDQATSAEIKDAFLEYSVQQLQLQIQATPRNVLYILSLGQIYDNYGDYQDSQSTLQDALMLSPNDLTVLYQLAINAHAAGDDQLALQYLNTAYGLNSRSTSILDALTKLKQQMD